MGFSIQDLLPLLGAGVGAWAGSGGSYGTGHLFSSLAGANSSPWVGAGIGALGGNLIGQAFSPGIPDGSRAYENLLQKQSRLDSFDNMDETQLKIFARTGNQEEQNRANNIIRTRK